MAGWRMNGEVLIACNCDWGCPCNFNARPSRGFCQGGWIWIVEDGEVDHVSIGGLGLALFARWPGAIHEGGGRATSYVDSRADAAQRSALARVLAGEIGGPWGIFSKTYQLAPPVSAPFDVRLAQHDSRALIGDVVELKLTKMRNPVTKAEAHPEVLLPEGLVMKRGGLASSAVFRVKDELALDHSGQYAAFGRFQYS
jgi:hypothetical protein